MAKFIGLDVGTKRIGVSKADSDVRIAIPVTTINVDGTELDEIARIARLNNANIFVVGLPRNSKGEETAQSAYARDFAKKLKSKIPTSKICFEDESLTSVEAENRLKNKKHGYSKGDIDAEAAVIILQDFLERLVHNVFKEDEVLSQPAKKKPQSKKSKSFMLKLKNHPIIIVICCILAGAVALCIGALVWYNVSLAPALKELNCEDNVSTICTSKVTFVIKSGESISSIASRLAEENIINSKWAFRIHVFLNNMTNTIKSGTYELLPTSSTPDIANALTTGVGSSAVFRLTILPGETISKVEERLLGLDYNATEVRNVLDGSIKIDHPVLKDKPTTSSLEGYMYGETYEFYVGEKLENIIKRVLDELYSVIQKNNLEAKFAEHGLNLHEGIILASVIQKEAGAADRPTVAQVFYSRLAKKDRLGADATAKYAADLVDPYRNKYTSNAAVLDIDSCYNTRKYAGLPCGPISSPGESALQAVASPSDTSYYYFLTGDDGKMYYSNTDAEHRRNISEHCKDTCKISL